MGVPPTFTDGNVVHDVDLSWWQASRPICSAFSNVNTSIATSTFTSIPLASETVDTDGQHDLVTNNSRIVIGKTLGLYRVQASVSWNANATGSRRCYVFLNGTTLVEGSYVSAANAGAGDPVDVVGPVVYVRSTAVTDYVEIQAWQNSGGALALLNNTAGKKTQLTAVFEGV
jgi:hypothetical protein